MEVLLASLPDHFEVEEIDEWLEIFEKVKQYVFTALVDPKLHLHSTQIIKRFWCCPNEKIASKSIEVSKRTLLHALRLLYSGVLMAKVDEAAVVQFLRELRARGNPVAIEVTNLLEAFRTTHPSEYESSALDTVFVS